MSETINPEFRRKELQVPQLLDLTPSDNNARRQEEAPILDPEVTEFVLDGVNRVLRTYAPIRHFGRIIKI